jgi:hypothetical protein
MCFSSRQVAKIIIDEFGTDQEKFAEKCNTGQNSKVTVNDLDHNAFSVTVLLYTLYLSLRGVNGFTNKVRISAETFGNKKVNSCRTNPYALTFKGNKTVPVFDKSATDDLFEWNKSMKKDGYQQIIFRLAKFLKTQIKIESSLFVGIGTTVKACVEKEQALSCTLNNNLSTIPWGNHVFDPKQLFESR